jgi:hypothetical protein
MTTQNDIPGSGNRHKLPAGYRVAKTTVLGGLHHVWKRPHNDVFGFLAENTRRRFAATARPY